MVQATTTCELPHSFARIECGAIGREEVQGKMVGLPFPPGLVESGGVIGGMVRDDDYPSSGATTGLAELAKELKKAGPVAFARLRAKYKAPIPQAHGSEIPNTLARPSMP